MYVITFLRHAESEGNVQQVLQGKTDTPLTDRGIEQAHQLAELWKANGVSFDRIISSPLQRARQTAQAVADCLGVTVEIDPIWIECDFGGLEGMSYALIRQIEPPVDYFTPYEPVGQTGESQVDLFLRACRGVQGLLRQPEARYLVISHGAILGKVMYAIFGLTPQGHYNSPVFRFENLSYIHLSYLAARRQWNFYGFTSPALWSGQLPEVKGPL